MTLFELISLATLALAIFAGLYWLAMRIDASQYLSEEGIEQRLRDADEAINNRPRVRAFTEINKE